MRKMLICLSVCMIVNTLVSTKVIADTTNKKHHKKHKQHHMNDHSLKKEKGTPAINTANKTPDEKEKPKTWLDNVSGSFDLTTNYMFRGISQSRNLPAVQGGLTYAFPIGFYLNVWGSNVNFPTPNGATATVEIDTIVGYRGGIGDNFTYDINVDRYNYPGARSGNYNEFNTLWTYRFFQLGVSYTDNYSGTHARGQYTNGTITLDIPSRYALGAENLSFQAEMGHYSLARAAGNSYNDYGLALNKKISSTYTVTAQWTGTNGRAKQSPFDDNQLLATVTASF